MNLAPRIVVVPSAPALLPSYAGLVDPLPDVRRAAVEACSWLVADTPAHVVVLCGDDLAARVGVSLLAAAGIGADFSQTAAHPHPIRTVCAQSAADDLPDDIAALLVVADGSARRGEKAPGHLDPRAHAYDADIAHALAAGDAAGLEKLDECLGAELMAGGVPALRALGALAGPLGPVAATMDYSGDPYGVSYWVVRWTCGS